jgi:hypothetical protein
MRAVYFVFFMIFVANIENVQALEIEKFFMPGNLISGHQDLEAACENCHVRLRETTQRKLCLDCHELVEKDIRSRKGFHGKDNNARSLDCKSCHSDHQGRDATIIWLDRDKFDHQFTDYRLLGQHKLAECGSCHAQGDKFREAENSCNDCHSSDDVHKGKLGSNCADCHQPDGWGKSDFNHDNTDFKLKYSHQRVSCNACHLDTNYKKTPKRCVSCHAIKDVHVNRFGDECENCHQEKQWSQIKFDHNRVSKFSFSGKHRLQSCNSCHSIDYQALKKPNRIRSCYSCHRSDDIHRESNGKKCQKCHVDKGWNKTSFDHDTATEFALRGGHEKLLCEACHVAGEESKKIDMACYSCHKQDDVHKRDQGNKCGDCHDEVSWQHEVRFDHDISVFPLIGQHAVVGCESCHESSVFGDTGDRCDDCHRSDDVHKQKLGEDCALCHNSNAWLLWKFDHDETTFELKNAHSDLHCENCHRQPLKNFSSDWLCVDCHRLDDTHQGRFGGECDKCHNDKNFSTINIKSMTTFDRKTDE